MGFMADRKRPSEGHALIQTTVPEELAKWVQKQAEIESISVSAWLRRLVLKAQGSL
jgi:hypothetical protein